MRSRFVVIVSILMLGLLTGCNIVNGSGNVVTDERAIDDFEALELNTSANVTVRQGESSFLVIRGEDNIIDQIETVGRGNRLIIRNRNRGVMSILRNTRPVEITVTTSNLDEIDVSGSGNITAETINNRLMDVSITGSGDVTLDQVETETMDISISGSGDVDVETLSANFLDVTINGSGDVELAGEVNRVDFSINGSGEIKTEDLSANAADIRVNGSGDIELWVKETLDVRVNGSGDVRYYGNPSVDQRIGGSGDIVALGDR